MLFGAELSAYGSGSQILGNDGGRYSDSLEINKMLDYRLYSYNHYGWPGWGKPKKRTHGGYIEHGLETLTDLIKSKRADCIAHPFLGCLLYHEFEDFLYIPNSMSDQELANIFRLSKECGVAWEINSLGIYADPDFMKRYWDIGCKVGVDFNFGTGAHELSYIDPTMALKEFAQIIST